MEPLYSEELLRKVREWRGPLQQTQWMVLDGGSGNWLNAHYGVLTQVRFDGLDFYVRENIVPPKGWFNVSSGERQGLHSGLYEAPRSWYRLEVAADKSHLEMAKHITEAIVFNEEPNEELRLPVYINRRFTVKWAKLSLKYPRQDRRRWEAAYNSIYT